MNQPGIRMGNRRRDERGFTLIELLVVIVILGILSAVVVFAVRGVGDRGQTAADATDVKSLRTAQESYCAKAGQYGTEAQLAGQAAAANGETYKFLSEAPGPSARNHTAPVSSLDTTTPNTQGNCPASGAAGKFTLTCSAVLGACPPGVTPVGGTLKVPGTTTVGNVQGLNFVNPAVSSSGTLHPNVEYMFNGLLRFDTGNAVQPDLAASYTISPDQQTATFNLRPGMVWHDNSPILNSDVKFTFEKALIKFHSRTGPSITPALGGSNGGTSAATVPATAITLPATNVVQFNFVYAYAPIMLKQMNVTEAPIIPESVYGSCDVAGNINTAGCPANNPPDDADFPADTATRKKPVGSGPFRFKRRQVSGGTAATLTFVKRSATGAAFENAANGSISTPYHLAGLPLADTVVQVPTSDTANSLKTGAVDVGTPANNRILPVVPPTQTVATTDITPANGFTLADVPRGSGGHNCITTFAFHLWQYGTNVNTIGALPADSPYTHEIFGDPTPIDPDGAGPLGLMPRGKVVRRAISMSLDRQALFNSLDFGKGRVPDSPYHSKLPPYQAQPAFPTLDTATAATWLDNAGWTIQGGIRKANFTTTMQNGTVAPGTPLAWATRRTSGGQDNFYQGMKTQLLAAPVSIDVTAGTGVHAQPAVDASTQVTGALVAGNRNYDMLTVSFCAGDDPVIGVRRQYHSDGIPASGAPSNFTNPAGVRSSVMDGYWNTAFGANYTARHQSIQAMSADDAYQIYWDETTTTRAWKSSRCSGFNNFNTGLYLETASCAG